MLEEFLYFDSELVDSLANQITGRRVASESETAGETRTVEGHGVARLGFSFARIFGGPSGEVEAGGKAGRSEEKQTTGNYVPTREGRYQAVIRHLGGMAALRRDLDGAWHQALGSETGGWFIASAEFQPVKAGGPDRWRTDANKVQLLQLTDTATGQFMMHMSLSKMPGVSNGRIQPTGHLAMRLRNGAQLTVFGRMNRSRYIKPVAASW